MTTLLTTSITMDINIKGDDNMLYCRLPNGELISKRNVDNAIEVLSKIQNGFEVFEISDSELFLKGNFVEAVRRYHEKNGVSLTEAKEAIDILRNEWKGE